MRNKNNPTSDQTLQTKLVLVRSAFFFFLLLSVSLSLGLGCGDRPVRKGRGNTRSIVQDAGTAPDAGQDPGKVMVMQRDGDNGTNANPCDAYLACTLLTCPECYAGALDLYGEEAACWDTPEQADACDHACEELLADLDVRVVESECFECTEKLGRLYYDAAPETYKPLRCDDGTETDVSFFSIKIDYDDNRDVIVKLIDFGRSPQSPDLRGTHPCEGGSFEVSGENESRDERSRGYFEDWTMTLTPRDDGQTFTMSLTQVFTFTNGSVTTCTLTDAVQVNQSSSNNNNGSDGQSMGHEHQNCSDVYNAVINICAPAYTNCRSNCSDDNCHAACQHTMEICVEEQKDKAPSQAAADFQAVSNCRHQNYQSCYDGAITLLTDCMGYCSMGDSSCQNMCSQLADQFYESCFRSYCTAEYTTCGI